MSDQLPEFDGNKVYGEGGATVPPKAVDVGRTAEQLDKLPTLDLTTLEKNDRIIVDFTSSTEFSTEEAKTNMVVLVLRPPVFDPFDPRGASALPAEIKIVAGQEADKTKRLRLNGGLIGGALSTVEITNGMPLEMQTLPPPNSRLPGILATRTIITPPAVKISLIREGKKYKLGNSPKPELKEQGPDEFDQVDKIMKKAVSGTPNPYILKAKSNEVWLYDPEKQMVVALKKIGRTVNITTRGNVKIGDLGDLSKPCDKISTTHNISQNPKINGIMGIRIPKGDLQGAGLDLRAGIEIWVNQGEVKVRNNIHIQGDRAEAERAIKKIKTTITGDKITVVFGRTTKTFARKPDLGQIGRIMEKARDFASRRVKE